MIRVYYARDGNSHELSVRGHADYAEHGQDIVCAGVSALVQALYGWIEENEAHTEDISGPVVHRGRFWVNCRGDNYLSIAFQMAMIGIRQIANAYPNHVELRYMPEQTG